MTVSGFVRKLYDDRWAWLFLLPAVIPFVLLHLYPLLDGVRLSFYRVGLLDRTYVGLANYVRLWGDPVFHRALINTLLFVLILVPATVVLSLGIALLVYPFGRWMQSFVRISFYMPAVAGLVVLSHVWRWMFNPVYGLLNWILAQFGIGRVLWISSPQTALPSLAAVVISIGLGRPIILFLAGLGAIPQDLFDAAKVDGANTWQEIWHVTLPLLLPTTLFILVTQTIGSFMVFVVVLLLTEGGPAYSTQTIVYQLYQTAFEFMQFGYALSMAVILMVLITTIAFLQFKFLGREVTY